MNVAIFGGTSPQGRSLVIACIDRGYRVNAIVKEGQAEKMNYIQHENVTVTEVDVFDYKKLIPLFRGVHAVFSVLWFTSLVTRINKYTNIVRSIGEALRQSDNTAKRFVLTHSWFTHPNHRTYDEMFFRYFTIPFIRTRLNGMFEAQQHLRNKFKDISWSVVLLPTVSNDPLTNKEIISDEGAYYVTDHTKVISCSDVARYLIQVVTADLHIQNVAAITTVRDRRTRRAEERRH